MQTNPLIFAIATLLAASGFVISHLLRHSDRATRILAIATAYGTTLTLFLILAGPQTALAVAILSGIFAGVAEAFALHYEMVHHPRDPKHRRCY